jgi:serine/threonine protein kinase
MSSNRNCPSCGTQIPTDGTNGLCPKCLLGEGLEVDTAASGWEATIDSSANLAASEPTSLGATFGEYELLDEIARGGMGVVYKARHRQLNRVVALKMILSGQLASEQDVQRFKQEAAAAAKLDHSGIVPIYDIGEEAGQHFFAMKLVEGGALAERLTDLRRDTRAVIHLLEQVTRAVHYAHQRGILHRDLKPANILLDEDGHPLITDLGLAKHIQSDSNLTHTGAVVGTPAYMPPEQAAGEKEITTAADIYSIGAMLYEALTGQPPHKADSPVKTLMQVLEADVTPPREVDRRIDRSLELICLKCLERDPGQRYSSASALADDLKNWLDGKPVSVRPPSLSSALSEVLRANLRTAVGAGLIGVVAGVLFGFSLSKMYTNGDIIENPPTKIYEAFPAEMPIGRSMVFMKEENPEASELMFMLGALSAVFGVGYAVAAVSRPQPGSEALALGIVASLLMSITLFTVQVGFGSAIQSQRSINPTVKLLANAALGTGEQSTKAKQQVFHRYPGLEEMAPEDRANTLAFRLFYDAIYTAPPVTVFGMTFCAILCMLPGIAGTTFGSKLLHERASGWITPVYLEFMCLVVCLAFSLCFQTILPSLGSNVPDSGIIGHWDQQVMLYSFLIFMAVIIYRRSLSWRWRLLIYVSFFFGFAAIF